MVVLLILHGYHLCKFINLVPDKNAAFRVKRNLTDRESQLQYCSGELPSNHKNAHLNVPFWALKNSASAKRYEVIPWDDLPWEAAEALTLREIDMLAHNTGIDESTEGPH